MDGGGVVDGFVRCKGTGFGAGVRVVDLSPFINSLTIFVIFGVAGFLGICVGRGADEDRDTGVDLDDSGIFTNEGAETCGMDDF